MISMNKNKTKIVATLGPVSRDEKIIEELILSGVNMFRINTSHNTAQDHKETIDKIKSVSKRLKAFTAVMIDLQGPKIRVGNLIEPIPLEKDMVLTFQYGLEQTDKDIVPVDYKGVAQDVKPGELILMDDGKIEVQVVEVNGDKVKAKVVHGDLLKPRKGLNSIFYSQSTTRESYSRFISR